MKKNLLKRCMSLFLAVLMLACNLPFMSFAADGDGITISSEVTAQGIEIDSDVEFTYYIEIDDKPYEGTAMGSDTVIYKITDGLLTMPYNVKATLTDIPLGAKYSIKRLEYDNDKYALIKERGPEIGDFSATDYWVRVDGGEKTKIDAKTFNEATDNGKNLTVTKYKDADGNEYDLSQIDELTGYDAVRTVTELVGGATTTTYSIEEKTYKYVSSSLDEYKMNWDIEKSYSVSGKTIKTYTYTGDVTVGIDGYPLSEDLVTTEKNSSSMLGSQSVAKNNIISSVKEDVIRLSYRVLSDGIKTDTGKTAVLKGDITSQLPNSSTWTDTDETLSYTENAYSFTEVNETTAVYETSEGTPEKNIVFGDTVFAPAPTGTFSVDFIIYGGTLPVPEAYEDAEFEIRDINGNVLVKDEDYELNISSDSILNFGYTQYVYSGLKYGFYTVQQVKGADGYIVDSTIYPFEVRREDGKVVGEHFDKSDFKSQYTALTNNKYSLVKDFKVFKNNSFTLRFTKVDQNNDPVEGAEFMLVERDELLNLVITLARSGISSIGGMDIQEIISQLQGTDWSNLDVGTIIGLILNIVNLDPDTLSKITIPAILTAKSDKDGIVSISNSSNILNTVGALVDSGISGEKLAEALKVAFGSMIPEQYLPLLDTLANLAGTVKIHTGMRSGAYVMIETKAPAGYERNSLVYTFVIKADGTATVSAGVLFPVIVDAINSRFGIDLKEILVSPEEFERVKDTLGGVFETFDDYAGAVIDNVVNFLGEILGEDNATGETLTKIRDQIHYNYEQFGDLADAIGETIRQINSAITDQVTEDWHYYDTRYYVEVKVNITDCAGNAIDGATYSVLDSDGNEMEINNESGIVIVPFGDYTIKDVVVPDGYVLIEDSAVTSVTVDDPAGEYSFYLSYHKESDPVVTIVDSSCETEGTKTTRTYCDLCGESLSEESEPIEAKGHSFGPWETTTSSTCTSAGIEMHTCTRCGFTETNDLNLADHDWQDDYTVDKKATCTEDGSKSKHCKNCDAMTDSTVIKATGHKELIDEAVEAGCTEPGKTQGSHCSVCGTVLEEQRATPAKGHAWGEPAFTWSEDGKTATAKFVCQRSEEHKEYVKALVNSKVKTPATCTEKGTTTYTATATFEGEEYTAAKDVADIPVKEHKFTDYHYNDDATYWQDGTETADCDNGCGAQDTRTAKGTKLVDEEAPTAVITVNGNKWYEFLNKITFNLFFNKTQDVTIEAEDKGVGLDKIYYFFSNTEIPEDEVAKITDWTEYENAFRINPDNRYVIYVKVVDKLGNTAYYSSDGIVLDATAPKFVGSDAPENGGIYCQSKSIDVTDENFDRVEVDGKEVSVTHPNNGYHFTVDTPGEHTIVVYDKAGNTLTVSITINAEHTYGEWIEVNEPTCVQRGYWERTCKYCGSKDTKTSTDDEFDLHHIWGEPTFKWSEDGKTATAIFVCRRSEEHKEYVKALVNSKVKTPATCTEKGITAYTATITFEGKEYTAAKDIADISAKGHSFTDYVSDKNATCTKDGTKTAVCDNCGEKDTVADPGSTAGHKFVNGVCTVCGEKLPSEEPTTQAPTEKPSQPETTTSQPETTTQPEKTTEAKVETTKSTTKAAKKNKSSKSPATGNASYSAAIAGMLVCIATGMVVITKKREDD